MSKDDDEPVGMTMERRNRVAIVTIDRPERRNALRQQDMTTLVGFLDEIDGDDDLRTLIITGAGSRAFSAGRDLKERADHDRAGSHVPLPMRGVYRNCFEALWECRIPTIAAINGVAVGGGFELALACDLRLAVEGARFALPESKRGMGANFGANVLARTVPSAIYAQWVYFGDFIGVVEAARWGIINEIVRPADLMPRSLELADELARRAPLTVGRYKAVLSRGRELPLAAALRADFVPDPYRSRDRVEGAAAFAEGRTPRWQGA